MKSSPIVAVPGEDLIPSDPAILDEIIRQAEGRLQAQLQAAIASDNRAMVLASIQAAASAALVVAGGQDDISGAGELASYAASFVLFLGSACAAWSARPVPFGFMGTNPADWVDAIKTNEQLLSARAHYAAFLDEYLRLNAQFMENNTPWTKGALIALVIAPIAAALVFVGAQIAGAGARPTISGPPQALLASYHCASNANQCPLSRLNSAAGFCCPQYID